MGIILILKSLKGGNEMSIFHRSPNKYPTHVALKIMDLNKSLEFYQRIMGFKILEKQEKKAVLTADGIHPVITLEELENIKEKELRRTGLYHFALLLPSRKDLGKFIRHIIDTKYPIIGASYHGISEAIYLQDIDDNGIEVYADTPVSTWRWKKNFLEMTTKPLDIEDILMESQGEIWEEIPQESIIGHIHLHVSDLNEAENFYVDALGFDVVTKVSNQATFISTGGYHHHIAFNIWNGKDIPPPSENSVGMNYFTLKLPDPKSRHETIDRLNSLGYEIKFENGSFITKDPSQNKIHLVT